MLSSLFGELVEDLHDSYMDIAVINEFKLIWHQIIRLRRYVINGRC